jgi:small neutral amino acid transporter SnatA (MarC family)
MGMIMAVLGGFLAIILGIIGLIFWFKQFLYLLGGSIPLILIIGGLIALFIGITEIKDTLKSKEEESRFDTFHEEPKAVESSANRKEEDKEKSD